MKCPNCKEVSLVISERKGIEIDYCPDCRGIWLDRGELDKMLEKSAQESQNQEASSMRDHRTTDHSHPHQYKADPKYYKRRKSFLEELFD